MKYHGFPVAFFVPIPSACAGDTNRHVEVLSHPLCDVSAGRNQLVLLAVGSNELDVNRPILASDTHDLAVKDTSFLDRANARRQRLCLLYTSDAADE